MGFPDGERGRINVKVEDMGGRVEDMGDKVYDINDKVGDMGDKVDDMYDKVDDISDKVDDVGGKVEGISDIVQCVSEKVQVVIDDGKEARAVVTETKSTIQQTANSVDEIKFIGNQIKQLLRAWLSPADPSTNHNIARKAQHKGTAVWFFHGSIFIKWKSTGSLLWIHGKRSGKSVICSSVIQDIMAVCKTGSVIVAYFYFDFRDLKKQTCHDLLFSLVSQLSTRSSPCCDILHRVYKIHESGARQLSDDTLKECLKEMLRLLGQGPTFIVLDALDECPDSPGIPSPRYEVLQLVKELVDLDLQGLHICATSRPENLRQFLNELPESLDETYERILRGINKAQRDNAHRLLQCLGVAVRPLRVEELAELLAFDFQASRDRGIPKLKDDWQWDNQEEALLSTCSSLIAIVPSRGSRIVQFSHFSVKEYLTSPRLARSHEDVSKFYIDLDVAHTILAQACLGTLLRLDEHADTKGFPLIKYAAKHWMDHTRSEKVSSCVRDGIDDLFDSSMPHFAVWLRVHNMDESWASFSHDQPEGVGSPLYYAAFCGFHDLAERLITKRPEQVNAGGGHLLAPLLAALYKRHFDVATLLHKHGAVVDLRGATDRTLLYTASYFGHIDVMGWLLNHGADPNARTPRRYEGWTPLHIAATYTNFEAVQILLEHSADVNSRRDNGNTPLHDISHFRYHPEGKRVDVMQRLLEHGANPNACDNKHSAPLHRASSKGLVEVARLLLNYRANIDERDGEGRTPFQVALLKGHHEMTKLLLEHGAMAQP
ncbi:ankyrin repeat-containing domain protein [Lactarius pseudohatsudake]|nr:ankyrin repeat-containing domain protein [Lactarius pseudohatsudake]